MLRRRVVPSLSLGQVWPSVFDSKILQREGLDQRTNFKTKQCAVGADEDMNDMC